MTYLKLVVALLLYVLRTLTFGWLLDVRDILRRMWALLVALWKRRNLPHPDKDGEAGCITTDHPSVRRPDPCIYSQQHLMSLGLPVTWDNPDIVIRRNGVVVPEGELLPATQYEVEATIWNNSYDAPVAGMRVDFSFLSFGVGATSTAIGSTVVDVGAKGTPQHPARTTVLWTTPPAPGHFCLQVQFFWIDDKVPGNNLGQNNVNVVAAASPALFTFQLRNAFQKPARFTFAVDTYRLPDADVCPATKPEPEPRVERMKRLVARHRALAGPVPPGWTFTITPDAVSLGPGDEVAINVAADPPPGFVGAQTFNVNAFGDGVLAGGVTLVATKA
jgi:hypothetical protein